MSTATLWAEWEQETDVDMQDYPGLRDDFDVCNCGGCGRLLLARRHLGERHPAYSVGDADALPPVQYGWRVTRVDGRVHKRPECVDCHKARRRGERGGYALTGGGA